MAITITSCIFGDTANNTNHLPRGGHVTAVCTITVARNGYTGNITVSATGLPSGVSTTLPFTIVNPATQATFTFSATSGVTPVQSTITITAAGDASPTTTVVLTITEVYPHLVLLQVDGLSTGVRETLTSFLARWRRGVPIPLNVLGVGTPRPVSGQMWPRGDQQKDIW